ncbi:hypothetical protein ACFE04_030250 [Oxalis oulophora]
MSFAFGAAIMWPTSVQWKLLMYPAASNCVGLRSLNILKINGGQGMSPAVIEGNDGEPKRVGYNQLNVRACCRDKIFWNHFPEIGHYTSDYTLQGDAPKRLEASLTDLKGALVELMILL